MRSRQVTIRMPLELVAELERLAEADSRTMSAMAVVLLRRALAAERDRKVAA